MACLTRFWCITLYEQKVADALAQREREKAESEQGRFVEIRDAALYDLNIRFKIQILCKFGWLEQHHYYSELQNIHS
jgi:hypothetical protein